MLESTMTQHVSLDIIYVLLLSLINICSCNFELIWYDAMDNYTSHWAPSGSSSQQIINDGNNTYCTTSPHCVEIRGYLDGDDWIIRTVSLPIIANIDAYNSFRVQFDVTLSNMEDVNYCHVAYKYDTDNTYSTIRYYAGSFPPPTTPLKLLNQTGTINIGGNNSQILHIKLETIGDSSVGNDYCYFDNVYLFGHLLDNDLIFYDDMDDIVSTGWIKSNNLSITQRLSSYCSSGGCIEIRGYDATDNSIYNSISNIDQYFDLVIEFDVYFRNMEPDNACQVWYRYDTDPTDFYLLRSIAGGNGDYLDNNHIITIHDDPQYKNSSILYIKFATFGNSLIGGDFCYFDNIYVKGTFLNETNRAELAKQLSTMTQIDNDLEHIIIMGDMGGQSSAPYYTKEQVTTADILSTIGKYYDISGIIALGDNMYDSGVQNEFDPRFVDTFENVYTHTNIKDINWYFTTGNHDYIQNITGEVEYSKHSPRWNFPSLYYSKSWYFGENDEIELLFVALDTYILCGSVTDPNSNADCIPPNTAQAQIHWNWLNDTLSASNATFKIVGGHTPIYSYAHHGPTVQLIDELNPLLEFHKVNAYIFGHDHVVQYIEDNTTSAKFVQHIGSGAGHGCRDSFPHINSELNPSQDALKYMDCDQGGFVRLTIDTKKMTMQAFYYLSNSPNVQFFSGIWNAEIMEYKTINDILYGDTNHTMTPTSSPTNIPTPSPTLNPTPSPTDIPTDTPTPSPTDIPTDTPTPSPTDMPTPSPTDIPTLSPTNIPTPSPTNMPTPSPTNNPTVNPTNMPTSSPTDKPSSNPTNSPTKGECDADCEQDDGEISIKVIFWFRQWIIYDLRDIECCLYTIFAEWFAVFDFMDKFDVCDIEISLVHGGNQNSNDNKCVFGPCFWNTDGRRSFLSMDGDGNTSMIIISNDKDIYIEVNGLALDLIETEFEMIFNDTFGVDIDVNVEMHLFEDEDEDKQNADKSAVNAIEAIVIIIIIFWIVWIVFMIIFCIWHKKRNSYKKMNVRKVTTEMIATANMSTEIPSYAD